MENSVPQDPKIYHIKSRRLNLAFDIYPDIKVGDCAPFYFCPRSVMLYLIYRGNHQDLTYCGGQGPLIHLEANISDAINWAEKNNKRWIFTKSNAGSYYVEQFNNLNNLDKLNWEAINTHNWKDVQDEKQAEFLIEEKFPWELISCIGVSSQEYYTKVNKILSDKNHKPNVSIKPDWYYYIN